MISIKKLELSQYDAFHCIDSLNYIDDLVSSNSNTLLLIEKTETLNLLTLEEIEKINPRKIFCINIHAQDHIYKHWDQNTPNSLLKRVILNNRLDLSKDDHDFTEAEDICNLFISELRENLNLKSLHISYLDLFSEKLIDRNIQTIRVYRQLGTLLENSQIERVVCLVGEKTTTTGLINMFTRKGIKSLTWISNSSDLFSKHKNIHKYTELPVLRSALVKDLKHLIKANKKSTKQKILSKFLRIRPRHFNPIIVYKKLSLRLKHFSMDKSNIKKYSNTIRNIKKNNIVFFASVADKQYADTVYTIARKLSEDEIYKQNILVFAPAISKYSEGYNRRVGTKTFKLSMKNTHVANIPTSYIHAYFKTLRQMRKTLCDNFLWSFLEQNFYHKQLISELGYTITLTKTITSQFSSEPPKIVIASPGRHLEARLAVRIAKTLKIPTLDIQGGTISPGKRFRKPLACKLTCLESYSAKIYQDTYNIPKSSIEIVGAPRIDKLLAPYRKTSKDEARKKVFKHLNIDTEKVILFASQPLKWETLEIISKELLGALRSLNCKFKLIIKLHPKEPKRNYEFYNSIFSNAGFDYIINQDLDTYLSIKAADVVLTYYSTVGIEAYALQIPLITINPFSVRPPYDLFALGICKEAKTSKDILKFLKLYLSNNTESKLLHKHRYLQDGKSVDRICSLINRMTLSNQK